MGSTENTLCNVASVAGRSLGVSEMQDQCELGQKTSQARDVGINLLSRLDMIEMNYKKYAEAFVQLQS